MFTANLAAHKIRHEELTRQAEQYRLRKVANPTKIRITQTRIALGKLMVNSGRQLLTLAEAVR